MATVRRYFAVVHVRWELPFLLRLPPQAFYCWEPQEGTATFASLARVGSVQWRRTSPLLSAEAAFGDLFEPEPDSALPAHDYRMAAVIQGREYFTTQLHRGAGGGFDEVQMYSVANVWICLRNREEFEVKVMMQRASAALNNVLSVHWFLAADGRTRLLRPDLDSYYTLFSLAPVPDDWPPSTAEELLGRLGELKFQSDVGHGRQHNVGLGSADDLTIRPFASDMLDSMAAFVRNQIELAVHQQLFLSALRRLNRRENFLAIIDAESAFEVAVSYLLRRAMLAHGSSDQEIEAAFESRLSGLQQQIVQLDKLASALTGSKERFENSDAWRRWNRGLARLRHDVVHRGLRQISPADAREGVSAGMAGAIFLEDMLPDLAPSLRWGPEFAKLEQVRDSAGKLFRLFDA